MIVRWLLGVKSSSPSTVAPTLRLLYSLVLSEGDLTESKRIRFGLASESCLCRLICVLCSRRKNHTTPQPFYGPFSGTTWVSRCQKRTSGFYGARED